VGGIRRPQLERRIFENKVFGFEERKKEKKLHLPSLVQGGVLHITVFPHEWKKKQPSLLTTEFKTLCNP